LVEAGKVTFVAIDLIDPAAPAGLVAAAIERGRLDILINNVGAVVPRLDGFVGITDEDWYLTFTAGLMAAVRTTRAAVPSMLRQGAG
jgi:NAD(P)-dependent dehydrogenase (short-subunit alcohol dehydrogenase family)